MRGLGQLFDVPDVKRAPARLLEKPGLRARAEQYVERLIALPRARIAAEERPARARAGLMDKARQRLGLTSGFGDQQERRGVSGQPEQFGLELLRHAGSSVEGCELAGCGIVPELAGPARIERTLDGGQELGE